jgi:hypothetical protein
VLVIYVGTLFAEPAFEYTELAGRLSALNFSPEPTLWAGVSKNFSPFMNVSLRYF